MASSVCPNPLQAAPGPLATLTTTSLISLFKILKLLGLNQDLSTLAAHIISAHSIPRSAAGHMDFDPLLHAVQHLQQWLAPGQMWRTCHAYVELAVGALAAARRAVGPAPQPKAARRPHTEHSSCR